MKTFEQLGLATRIHTNLAEKDITTPTPIQEQTIPIILTGKNIIGSSPTGSGKTIAYLAPILSQLLEKDSKYGKRVLILSPTRELALQISNICELLIQGTSLKYTTIYGGVGYEQQIESLALSPDIIIATPGRLIDLISQEAFKLEDVAFFVLDEIDQMVNLSFREAIEQLSLYRLSDCQTIGFSATPSQESALFLQELMPAHETIEIQEGKFLMENIHQQLFYVEQQMMSQLLFHLILKDKPDSAIIFTRSRKTADQLTKELNNRSIQSEAMHSDRSQVAREYILGRFASGETKIIVATDVMARGIDVDHVTHVYNYGLPQGNELFIHRIGRTGRAGREGYALTLCDPKEQKQVIEVQKLIKRQIPLVMNHPFMTLAVTKAMMEFAQPSTSKKKNKKKK